MTKKQSQRLCCGICISSISTHICFYCSPFQTAWLSLESWKTVIFFLIFGFQSTLDVWGFQPTLDVMYLIIDVWGWRKVSWLILTGLLLIQSNALCSPLCPWPQTSETWSVDSPLAVALGLLSFRVWWETCCSAPHILVVSEDKDQDPSPVNVSAVRLIIMGKHTRTTKITPHGTWQSWQHSYNRIPESVVPVSWVHRRFYLGSYWTLSSAFQEMPPIGSLLLTKKGNRGRKPVVSLLSKADNLHHFLLPYWAAHSSLDLLFAGYFSLHL